MKVFYDAEFVENGPQIPIQPISFGFVTEEGEEFYGINADSLSNLMRNPWLLVNVRPNLPIQQDSDYIYQWDAAHPDYEHVLALGALAHEIQKFLTSISDVELWAYYGAYDHVVLCQLFGAMKDLPSGIPMWTHDLMQLAEHYPGVSLPPQNGAVHHALEDARWNMAAYQKLTSTGDVLLIPESSGLQEIKEHEKYES